MSCFRVMCAVRVRGCETGLVWSVVAGQQVGSVWLSSPSFAAAFGSSRSLCGRQPRPALSIGFSRISIRERAVMCRPAVRRLDEKAGFS